MIKEVRFNHSNIDYLYRVHTTKIKDLNGDVKNLKRYLMSLFENCPTEYFNFGPRSSMLNFKVDLELHFVKGHEIIDLARHAINSYSSSSHEAIQTFFLQHDNKTLSTEVPIWLKKHELENFKNLFASELPLTGHIDILRVEGDKIWIWDYKPNIQKEKYAPTQVFFYALMLSKRAGIDINKIGCGYFNKDYAYIFKPDEKIIENLTKGTKNLASFIH